MEEDRTNSTNQHVFKTLHYGLAKQEYLVFRNYKTVYEKHVVSQPATYNHLGLVRKLLPVVYAKLINFLPSF